MKSIFKKIAVVLALAMIVTMLPAKAASAATSDGPQMYSTLRLYIGGDKTGTYSDANYAKVWNKDGYTVAFESDAEEVATVNAKGYVRAVSVGTANITATFTAKNGTTVTKTCVVTVKKNATAAGIGAKDKAALEAGLTVGTEMQLVAVRKDENGTVARTGKVDLTDGMRFQSSDESVFTVGATKGKLVAVGVGEATLTVWAVQTEGSDPDTDDPFTKYLATTEKKEYTVVVRDFSAKATGVKEITVTGLFTEESEFAVTKGTSNVAIAEKSIAEDGKTAVLILGGKLTDGTYTVTCGDDSASFTAEDQKVVEIVVFEDGSEVTVNPASGNKIARTEFYVHYDVLDQYGDSVRKNFDVQWSASTGSSVDRDDKELGVLTIPASRDADGVLQPISYGTTIILTGIHTSGTNTKTVNAVLTAGRENHVSTIEYVGITKEYSSQIDPDLPADFSNGDYLLLFNMIDLLGYPMSYNDEEAQTLIFTSLNPLMLGAFDITSDLVPNGVTINGETYGAIRLTRGMDTSKGGTANIQVTSGKVGKSSMIELRIVSVQVLSTFQMYTPDSIIAEGDGAIEIPFEAYDIDGQPITDYRALCEALTFSDPALNIVELNDGSATLIYNIPANAGASKNVDATRIYTSTVIKTGSVSTLTLMIKDEAVPAAVKGFGSGVATVGAEGLSQDLGATSLVWYDQYDREMSQGLAAARMGTNLAAIKVNANSTSVTVSSSAISAANLANGNESYIYFSDANPLTITFNDACTQKTLTETFEFALAEEDGKISGGSAKKLNMMIVDVGQCTSFNFGTWGGKLKVDDDSIASGFWFNGVLPNGTTVTIPEKNQAGYAYVNYVIEMKNGTNTDIAAAAGTSGKIESLWNVTKASTSFRDESGNTVVTGAAIMNGTKAVSFDGNLELFKDKSKMLPNGEYEDRFLEATGKAEIYTLEPDDNGNFIATLKDVVTTTVSVGTAERVAAYFSISDNSQATINADGGIITYKDLIDFVGSYFDNYDHEYDVSVSTGVKITVSKLTESAKGVHFGSTVNKNERGEFLDMGAMAVVTNATTASGATMITMIKNAEIGDTFVATYEYQNAVVSILFTVGSDKTAYFNSANDKTIWR